MRIMSALDKNPPQAGRAYVILDKIKALQIISKFLKFKPLFYSDFNKNKRWLQVFNRSEMWEVKRKSCEIVIRKTLA